MSATVDQRVVEMKFDNKHFEQNVSTTMSTLEKLKQRLKFTGATKGLEDVSGAVQKIDFKQMESTACSAGFKIQDVFIKVASVLEYQIARRVIDIGKKITSALTIDPIKTGFSEYETKINAIQTIMSNTASKGTTMKDVTKVIDELNTYADKTIYNFAEMTRNIGTFTAAGVGLEESAAAIQGIANLAAASGSTSQQASTAMYQLSQALAAGTVKLMDWNSVVNAGMGGEKFQEALKATAREYGVAIDDIIARNGSFRESLHEGWITADILNTTLRKFTVEGAKEYADSMVASGKYTQEQADALMKEAQSMEDAATKVKTFTQLWDTMKESVQSGWGKTWELLFGNFEEAKELFTGLSDFFGGFINKMSDFRNDLLESALGRNFKGLWNELSTIMKPAEKAFETVDKVIEGVTRTMEEHEAVVDSVIRGDWGNYTDRYNKLSKAGYDWMYVQNLVNEKLGSNVRHTSEYTEAIEKNSKSTEGKTKADAEYLEMLTKKSDEELRSLGYTERQIKAIRELKTVADKLGMSIKELLDNSDDISGRWLLLNSFKNIGQSIVKIFKAIGQAWVEIFPPPTADALFDAIAGFHKLSQKLRMSDETADKLRRTFKGVFALIDILATILSGGLRIAFKAINALLGLFDLNLLDVTAGIGDALVAFRDWIDAVLDFDNIFSNIGSVFTKAIKGIKNWIKEIKKSDNVPKAIAEGIVSGLGKAVKAVGSFFKGLGKDIWSGFTSIPVVGDWLLELSKTLKKAFKDLKHGFSNLSGDMILGFLKGLWDGIKTVGKVVIELGKIILEKIKGVLGIHSPSTEFFDIAKNCILGFWDGIKSFGKLIWDAISNVFTEALTMLKNAEFGQIFSAVISTLLTSGFLKIAGAIAIIAAPLENLGNIFDEVANTLKVFQGTLKSVSRKNNAEAFKTIAISIAILAAAVIALSFIDTKKMWIAIGAVATLAGIVAIVFAVVALINKQKVNLAGLGKQAVSMAAIGSVLLGIGIAVIGIAAALKIIETIDPDRFKQTLIGLAAIVGGLFLILIAIAPNMAHLNANHKSVKQFGKILTKLAVSLLLIAAFIKIISGISWEDIGKAGAVAGGLAVLILALSVMGAASKKTSSMGIGASILMIAGALLLMIEVCKRAVSLVENVDRATLNQAANMIMQFSLVIGGLMLLTRLANGNDKFGGIGITLLGAVAAIGLMVLICEKVAKMDPKTVKQGIAGVLLFGGLVIGLIAITRVVSGNSLKGVAGTLIAASLAIGIMAIIAVLLGTVDEKNLIKGGIAVLALGLLVGSLIKATKGAKNVKGNLIVLAVIIGLLAAIVAALSFIDTTKLLTSVGAIAIMLGSLALVIKNTKSMKNVKMGPLFGLVGIIAILGIVAAALSFVDTKAALIGSAAVSVLLLDLVATLKILNKLRVGSTINKKIGTLALIGALVAGLAGITLVLSLINPGPALAGLAIVTVLLAEIVGVLAIINTMKIGASVKKALPILAILGLILAELAGVAMILSLINAGPALAGTAVVTVLLAEIVGVLAIINTMKTGASAKKAIGALALLSLVLVELAFVAMILSKVKAGPALAGAAAVSLLLGVVTGVLVILNSIKVNTSSALKGVLALAAMAVPLLAFVGILALMSNVRNAIPNVLALSILTTVLTVCLIPLTLIGSMATTALMGVLALTAMAVPLLAFVGVLALMSNIQNATANAYALSVLTAVLTLCLIPLALIGALAVTALIGVLALTAMAVPMLAFVGVLALMENIEHATTNTNLLVKLMTTLTAMLVILAVIGPMALIGVGAMAALTGLILGIGILATAIGALMEEFPQLQEFLNTGIPVLEQLAYAIGSMVGNIIAGFADAVMEVLPQIGTCLSQFMTNAQPFIDGLRNIDDSIASAAGNLALAILAITAADLVAGIAEFLPFGSSFGQLGTDLSTFMANAKGFIDGASQLNETMLGGVKALAETILILTAVDVINGVTSFISKGTSLSSFSKELPSVGTGLRGLLDNLGGMTDGEKAAVNCAAQAVKALASVASEIPNAGGLLGSLVGNNDLGVFADQFPKVGTGVRGMLNELGTFDAAQQETVKCAAEAVKTLAKASEAVPNTGGFLATLVGNNDLGTFADQFPNVGKGIRGMLDELGTFSSGQQDTVKCAASAVKTLAKVSESIPNSGGLLAKLVGNNDLKDFADQFPNVGKGIKGLVNELGTFTDDQVATVKCAMDALNVIAKMTKVSGLSKIPTFGKNLETLGTKIKTFCGKLGDTDSMNTAIANMENLIDLVKTIGSTTYEHLASFGKSLNEVGKKNVTQFIKEFTNADLKVDLKAAGTALMEKFIEGLESKKSRLSRACSTITSRIISSLNSEDNKTKMYNAGKYLVEGFANGIDENDYKATAKARAMAKAAAEAAEDELDEHSPSRVGHRIGAFFGLGFVNGIDEYADKSYIAGSGIADSAKRGLSNAINKINDFIDNDIDTQPTIRPILDLSDVESGASRIGGLFSLSPSMGVLANVGAISSMMNGNSQNGVNSDVVSAIDSLRKDLGNIGGTSYNINGITYDDGSNVSEAVKALVRAARIERRV